MPIKVTPGSDYMASGRIKLFVKSLNYIMNTEEIKSYINSLD